MLATTLPPVVTLPPNILPVATTELVALTLPAPILPDIVAPVLTVKLATVNLLAAELNVNALLPARTPLLLY